MAGCCGGSCSCKIEAADPSIVVTGTGSTGNPFLISAPGGGGGDTIHGTGFPEGVVTADIGQRYIDDAATNGAVEWLKTTDGGSSGWRVTHGNTGWREISSLLINNWETNDATMICRINDITYVCIKQLTKGAPNPGLTVVGTIPGFQPTTAVATAMTLTPPSTLTDGTQSPYLTVLVGYSVGSSPFLSAGMDIPAGNDHYYSGTGLVIVEGVPWPSILPGLPL